ncbi:MAG: hypothetical protein DME43_15425 [Verrucomicrobia bacterium]|nr:MAG: hypothetical protein DME43_15425 [Verrucomicrobiota bacterium]
MVSRKPIRSFHRSFLAGNNELKFARILESETRKDQDDNVDFGRFVFYFFSRIGGKSGAICASKRPQYGLNSGLT